MKKITALLISLVLLLSFATSTQAASKSLSIWVDGEQIQFGDQKPIVEKGTTLIPVRMLLEKLKFEIDWNNESRVVTATSKQATISLQIDHTTAYVNSKPEQLVVAPKIVDKVTYVPLRFIVEATGYEIDWNELERTILIDTVEESKGFLWKVEKNGNTVYLLGSIHVADESMYPLRSEIEDAYAEADYLAVEVNTAIERPDISDYLYELGTYKDGTSLDDHISAEAYEIVGQLLTELKLSPYALDEYEPWFASMILSSINSEDSEYVSELGIDIHFMNQALEAGTPILELESYQSQFEMFDNFSDELQEQMLIGSIYGFYYEDEGTEDLSEVWKSGDDEAVTDMAKDMQANEEYYNAMLKDRNILMVEKIQGYLNSTKSETYFVVVGALHMFGDHGLVKLLEEEGYTVTRM